MTQDEVLTRISRNIKSGIPRSRSDQWIIRRNNWSPSRWTAPQWRRDPEVYRGEGGHISPPRLSVQGGNLYGSSYKWIFFYITSINGRIWLGNFWVISYNPYLVEKQPPFLTSRGPTSVIGWVFRESGRGRWHFFSKRACVQFAMENQRKSVWLVKFCLKKYRSKLKGYEKLIFQRVAELLAFFFKRGFHLRPASGKRSHRDCWNDSIRVHFPGLRISWGWSRSVSWHFFGLVFFICPEKLLLARWFKVPF